MNNYNRKTIAKIIVNYDKMIYHFMNKYSCPTHIIKDVHADAQCDLVKTIKTYDKTRAKLSTYLYYKISKSVYDSVYKHTHSYGMSSDWYRKNKNKISTVSTTNFYSLATNMYATKPLCTQEQFILIKKMFVDKLQLKLNSKEIEVIIDYYIDGLSYSELKRKYGNIAKIMWNINKDKLNLKVIFDEIRTELRDT